MSRPHDPAFPPTPGSDRAAEGVDAGRTGDRGDEAGGAPVAADLEVDALGLLCPLPVLRARKRLAGLAPGATLAILADDPVAVIDLPHFCAEEGHVLLSQDADPRGGRRFLIRRGA